MGYTDRKRGKGHTENAVRPASKISAAALSLCLILTFFVKPLPVRASAAEPPDITDGKKYSIRIMMVYEDKTVEGGSFEAYRVGEIVKVRTPSKAQSAAPSQDAGTAGEAYRFWPTESLVKSMGFGQEEIDRINGIDRDEPDAESKLNAILNDKLGGSELNGIETAAQKEKLAKALATYVKAPAGQGSGSDTGGSGESTESGGTGVDDDDTGDGGDDSGGDGGGQEMPDIWGDDHTVRGNEGGVAAFENLRTGLYLFTQSTEQASPGYYPVEPFLVSVPVYDSEYNYNVQAFPNDYEVKIYVKFRLMAIPPDPPDPPDPPEPPDPPVPPDPPGPRPKPEPKPDPSPAPDPAPEPPIEQWARAYLAEPSAAREPETAPRLPQTGQINWPIPVLAVSGAALLLTGLLLRLAGRKNAAGEEDTDRGRE